jgi:hypothetical protein
MPTPETTVQRAAVHRRAEEVQESILADEEFMEAIRQGIRERDAGGPAVTIRELREQERVDRSR